MDVSLYFKLILFLELQMCLHSKKMSNNSNNDAIYDGDIENLLDSIRPHVNDFAYIKSCLNENSEKYQKFLKLYLSYNNYEFWADFVINHLNTDPTDILYEWDWAELSLDQYFAIQLHPPQIPEFVNENNRVFIEYWTIVDDEIPDAHYCIKCISYMLDDEHIIQKHTESISCAADQILPDIIRKSKYWCCSCAYCALFKIYDNDEDWSHSEILLPQICHNAIY